MKDKLKELKGLSDDLNNSSNKAGEIINQAVQLYRSPLSEKGCVVDAKVAEEVKGEVCSFCDDFIKKATQLQAAAKGL